MLDELIRKLKTNKTYWLKYQEFFSEVKIPAKTLLFHEGESIENFYFITKGCLRLWFNNDGNDITFQFFFEKQVVSSFLVIEPGKFNLESIEQSSVVILKKSVLDILLNLFPEMKNTFIQIIYQRLENYTNLFLSRIKDNPQERYKELLLNYPEILKRIPQHYIASYLGITAVSLSRIRNRK